MCARRPRSPISGLRCGNGWFRHGSLPPTTRSSTGGCSTRVELATACARRVGALSVRWSWHKGSGPSPAPGCRMSAAAWTFLSGTMTPVRTRLPARGLCSLWKPAAGVNLLARRALLRTSSPRNLGRRALRARNEAWLRSVRRHSSLERSSVCRRRPGCRTRPRAGSRERRARA